MSGLADGASLLAFRAGWALVRRMPERLAYACFDLVADVSWRRRGKSVLRMRSNYAKVRPELTERDLDALVRAGMRSYFRYWCEAFRLPGLSDDDLVQRVRAVDDATVRAHLDAGRPAVMFLAHLGNWDMGGAWSTTHLAPVTTVAERLRPEELFTRFLAYRESLGMHILPLTGGNDVFRELLERLRQGAFVALLGDRDLTSTGVEVQLCGHPARFAVGPAALALTTGALLQPVSVYYERRDGRHDDARGRGGPGGPLTKGRLHRLRGRRARQGRGPAYGVVVHFHDAVVPPAAGTTREKVRAMTQECADVLGAAIREHTEDWHMMQRVFVEDLDVAARPRASAAAAER